MLNLHGNSVNAFVDENNLNFRRGLPNSRISIYTLRNEGRMRLFISILFAIFISACTSFETKEMSFKQRTPASFNYCENESYSNTYACVGSRPDHCKNESSADSLACIGSKPTYCNKEIYANSIACVDTKPSYCSNNETYANSFACVGSKPNYCDKENYANSVACLGMKPNYCEKEQFANSIACLDSVYSPMILLKK